MYLKRNKAAAAFDDGVSSDAHSLGDDGAKEISLTEEGFPAGGFSNHHFPVGPAVDSGVVVAVDCGRGGSVATVAAASDATSTVSLVTAVSAGVAAVSAAATVTTAVVLAVATTAVAVNKRKKKVKKKEQKKEVNLNTGRFGRSVQRIRLIIQFHRKSLQLTIGIL